MCTTCVLSKNNAVKFGRAINELVKSGIVIQEDNKFKLKNDLSLEDVKRETVIENLIFEILKVEKKKELC